MNINLLPDKFVKNRAMDIIFIMTGFLAIMLTLLFVFLFLFYQLNVTKYTGEVTSQQMEKVNLEKKIKVLQQSQLVDLQRGVSDLKSEQQQMAPIMTRFSQVADQTEIKLLSYQVGLEMSQGEDSLSEGGVELLPNISIRVRGDFYKGVPSFKEAIEQIEWVYDCKPINITKAADYSEADYLVRLKKTEVPMTSRLEKKQDE